MNKGKLALGSTQNRHDPPLGYFENSQKLFIPGPVNSRRADCCHWKPVRESKNFSFPGQFALAIDRNRMTEVGLLFRPSVKAGTGGSQTRDINKSFQGEMIFPGGFQ